MNDSQQILEHLCRACMCKNQILHSLCDRTADKSLTIHEMLATTIPQVPIDNNDELPTKICAACLNTLFVVHKFQQMCIASDTYMRSLLVSNKIAIHSSNTEQHEKIKHNVATPQETEKFHIPLAIQDPQQSLRSVKVERNDEPVNVSGQQEEMKHIVMTQETEKFEIQLVTQDPNQFPLSVKVEINDDAVNESELLEPATCYQKVDAMEPEWSDDDDKPLKESGNLKLGQIEKDEFQGCMKFEIIEMECDLMTPLKSETALLERRDVYNDDSMVTVLDSYKDNEKNSEWNAGGYRRHQQQQPNILGVTTETAVSEIEKSSSLRQNKFPCPHCDAAFSGNYKLNQHSHLHDETRQFVCEICNYRFETSKNLNHHKKTHKITPPGGLKCPKCPRRFEKQISLTSHMNTHRDNIFKCDLCPKIFIKQTRLTDHLRKHKSQKFIRENEKKTDSNLELIIGDDNDTNSEWNDSDNSRHQKISTSNVSETEQHEASISNITNETDVFEIEKPFTSWHRQYKFACTHCDATFSSKSTLKRHSLQHDETRPFVCEICNYRFESSTNLVHHKKAHKITPPGGFKCPKCPRRFEKQNSLSSHMNAHRERHFECNLCPQKFEKLTRLTDHMRQHKSEKLMHESTDTNLERSIHDENDTNSEWDDADNSRYENKSTSNVSKAEQQQPNTSMDSNETVLFEIEKPRSTSRQFPCPHCDATFSAISNWRKHSHLHDEKRLFTCEICNYRFKTIGKLLHHKDRHKMTPPGGFKCPKCPRRFEKNKSLSSHMRTHPEHENDSGGNNLEQSIVDHKSEWIDGDIRYEKKPTSDVNKAEAQEQPSTSSVANETDVCEVEKPNSQFKYIIRCPHCDAVFSSIYKFKKHSRLHDEARLFLCDVCNYRFETSTNLLLHKKTHKITPPGGFKCSKCPRRFEKEISLSSHMKTHRKNLSNCNVSPPQTIVKQEIEDENTDTNVEQSFGE